MTESANGAEDRLPPHNAEVEQAAVGCMIESPVKCIAEYRSRFGVETEPFYDLRHQTIAHAVLAMDKRGEAIDLITLQQQLRDGQLLEQVGGVEYLTTLFKEVTSAENFPYYLDTLREKFAQRRAIQASIDFTRRLWELNGSGLDSAISEHEAIIQQIRFGGSSTGLQTLLEQRRFNPQLEPPALRSVFTLSDQPVCTPGNLTALTAAAKAGKTAAIGAMVAAAFPHAQDADLLGFDSDNPEKKAVVWIDSEQSPDDYSQCVRRAIRRTGLGSHPEWFYGYPVKGFGFKKSWDSVIEILRKAVAECGGIHSIFLDGAADFVSDVNDAEESNAFVATLDDLTIKHDCPIVTIIHFNPGGEKSRGHLGSQLERKAESNLALEKDGDEVTTIYSTKQRRAPIPKSTGPRFKYDTEAGMHVSLESRRDERNKQETEALSELAEEVFDGRSGMNYSEIISTLTGKLKKSTPTIERKVARMKELGVIKKCVGRLYQLGG